MMSTVRLCGVFASLAPLYQTLDFLTYSVLLLVVLL